MTTKPHRDKPLLRQNANLRRDRIWNWTLPAYVARLDDGRAVNVCPQAGACADMCYARNGSYRYPVVTAAHLANLELTLDDLDAFVARMSTELQRRKFRPNGEPRLPDLDREHLAPEVAELLDNGCAAVRIHDAGDYYSDDYLDAWVAIATATPDVLFYAYTKEVARYRRLEHAPWRPPNLLHVYSLGGKQDHMIDRDRDRHADVFPSRAALDAAGYYDQQACDLLAVLAPNHRVGIVSNVIPLFRKRQGERTFGQIEATKTRHSRRTHQETAA